MSQDPAHPRPAHPVVNARPLPRQPPLPTAPPAPAVSSSRSSLCFSTRLRLLGASHVCPLCPSSHTHTLGLRRPLPGNGPDQFHPAPGASSRRRHFCPGSHPGCQQRKAAGTRRAHSGTLTDELRPALGRELVDGTAPSKVPNPTFFFIRLWGLRTY